MDGESVEGCNEKILLIYYIYCKLLETHCFVLEMLFIC